MKNKRTLLGICIILIGLLILALPRFSAFLLEKNTAKAVDIFNTMEVAEVQEKSNVDEYDYSVVTNINVQETIVNNILGTQELINRYKSDIVGQITIPDVNINLTVFEGVNNDKLNVGTSTMKPGQEMGQGNYAIAGHASAYKNLLFTNLEDVSEGMIIKITDKETIYEYKVYQRHISSIYDVHLVEDTLSDNKGKPIISLMSCYFLNGINQPEKRLWIFGELVNTTPYSSEAMK